MSSLKHETTYYMLDGFPCRVFAKEHTLCAEKYFPSEGFAPVPPTDAMLDGSPISKQAFDKCVISLSLAKRPSSHQ